jgi:hypothetical protein
VQVFVLTSVHVALGWHATVLPLLFTPQIAPPALT